MLYGNAQCFNVTIAIFLLITRGASLQSQLLIGILDQREHQLAYNQDIADYSEIHKNYVQRKIKS